MFSTPRLGRVQYDYFKQRLLTVRVSPAIRSRLQFVFMNQILAFLLFIINISLSYMTCYFLQSELFTLVYE